MAFENDMTEIKQITIEEEMKRSYLDYAMSVIVGRALPDVRDGLKPVHRRILYGMKEAGYDFNRPYRKSARIVGDVMGKYHPHGDQAIYDSMVRMAQDFSMGLPLVDGQGNFGSMDGDPPAAMRYTEARLAKSTAALLNDIDKDTVDFQPNYDDSLTEPSVLPAEYPNLLVNGAGGIAVGMATNIPPHNLGEVIDACCAYLDHPEVTNEELMGFVKGPDFPTGGLILGRGGARSAFMTGRGSILIRAKTNIEEIRKDREAIIVTEIPYQLNKSRLMERIAEVVRDKMVEGISDLRDESSREGVRVVIEIKRDAMAEVVLNQLYKHTPLQTSFGANMLAICDGKPLLLDLRSILVAFVQFREQVITRRTRYLLAKARERAHVLIGLAVAVANIDPIIALIRKAKDPVTARTELMAKGWPYDTVKPLIRLIDNVDAEDMQELYHFTEVQARAILDLRLQKLTGLERDKIDNDLNTLVEEIKDFLGILGSRERLYDVMRDEFLAVKENFAVPRRSEIIEGDFDHDEEDLIQKEEMVVTVSHKGYIKRVPLSTYRAQKRGGRGRSGMSTRDEDFVTNVFVANTHTPILFFSSRGIVYQLKVYKLPLSSPQGLGKAAVNLLPLEKDEKISTIMALPEDQATWSEMQIMFATASGSIRRNALSDFSNIRANGKIAMKLDEGDKLVGVLPCSDTDDLLLATRMGKCIRSSATDVRVFVGRNSTGVRGIRLAKGDEVISLSIIHGIDVTTEERDIFLKMSSQKRRIENASEEDESVDLTPIENALSDERYAELSAHENFILTVTEHGFGKRTSSYEYRRAGRGGMGITAIEMSDRNGEVVAAFPVESDNQTVLVTDNGRLIRCPIHDVRIAGRVTQGVTLFKVDKDEHVVSVSVVSDFGDDEDQSEDAEGAESLENGAPQVTVKASTESAELSEE